MRETRSKSRLPVPPPPSQSDNLTVTFVEGQVGGGRRQPSPPPMETPTCLRARIKPTVRDTRLVQQAEHHRARLVDTHVVESNLQLPADVALVGDQHVLPSSKSNAEPSFFPFTSHPLITILHLVPQRLHPTPPRVPCKSMPPLLWNHFQQHN